MSAQTFTLQPTHPKGKCKVCAAEGMDVAAWDGRATKCVRHLTPRERANKGIPEPVSGGTIPGPTSPPASTFRVVRPDTASRTNDDSTVTPGDQEPNPDPAKILTEEAKAKAVNDLAAKILGLNGHLIKGFAWACDPIPTENFYAVDVKSGNMAVTPRGQQVMVSPTEAKWIARALVEAEQAPQAKAVTVVVDKMVKPYMPILSLLGAVGVVGWHGFQMVKLRDDLRHAWLAQQAQGGYQPSTESSSAGESDPRPADPVGDVTPEYTGPVDADGNPVEVRDVGALHGLRDSA